MKIIVNDNSVGLGEDNIHVVLSDVKFNCDCIGKPQIMFWLDDDTADSLVFHLGAILQDKERRKDLTKLG